MKLVLISLLAALSQLSGGPVAFADESPDSAIRPFAFYRCEAVGRRERGFVMGQAISFSLRLAELNALRSCRMRGGFGCHLIHCFRE
ncbi:MAG: hypothetical protein ACXVB9_14145 [Bdellovibrionota bacterium]